MIYRIFRFLFRITNRFYFRNLEVKGMENLPEDGPVMLVANHPSAFMDPIIVGTTTKRPLYFIAKGALFDTKLNSWLLKRLNLIPIYRNHETPEKAHLNKDTFSRCYAHLKMGGSLLIFPEGISVTERKLKKIQTGTARICLGAEAENDFSLNIKIVPIGLNYSNAHRFQSDLFVNIGPAISVSDYKEKYLQDNFKAAHALTDDIRSALEAQVVAIRDEEEERLVSQIEKIYKAQLLTELGYSAAQLHGDFSTTRAIRDTVRYFVTEQPDRVEQARSTISEYEQQLEMLSLEDKSLDPSRKGSVFVDLLLSVLGLLVGFPFFVLGFLHNYLPFRIPFWSVKFISRRPDYFGSIAYTVGTFTFLIFYTLQIYAFHHYMHKPLYDVLYAIFLPLSGLFAFRYYKRWKAVRNQALLFSLFYRRRQLIAALVTKRQAIIDMLESGRLDYTARTQQSSSN